MVITGKSSVFGPHSTDYQFPIVEVADGPGGSQHVFRAWTVKDMKEVMIQEPVIMILIQNLNWVADQWNQWEPQVALLKKNSPLT